MFLIKANENSENLKIHNCVVPADFGLQFHHFIIRNRFQIHFEKKAAEQYVKFRRQTLVGDP